ncbi:MAG: hypothetical protein B6D54_05460 [Epsilonproteobacteria bacterium 4484_65]|nr:MAG: hypothetical protein B6D54_05460 [Epsilonproteobacteria bacterium 4484_65]
MKNILLSLLLGFALMALSGCTGSENDTSTKKSKCQSGLCGGGKCDHGKKSDIKKAETPESDKSSQSK